MTEVMSRPATGQSLTGRLPKIQHPLSRLGNPECLDVQGTSSRVPSRAASGGAASGRPLAAEQSYGSPRRSLHSARAASVRQSRAEQHRPLSYSAIPEGVEVTQGDPNKTKLPIFGELTHTRDVIAACAYRSGAYRGPMLE